MNYYNVSIKIAITLSFLAIFANMILCVIPLSKSSKFKNMLFDISGQCRLIGILYFILSWLTGYGIVLDNRITAYESIARWIQLISIWWMVVFVISIISKSWNPTDNKGKQAGWSSVILFVISYLIH